MFVHNYYMHNSHVVYNVLYFFSKYPCQSHCYEQNGTVDIGYLLCYKYVCLY